jgi:hypothetical protein
MMHKLYVLISLMVGIVISSCDSMNKAGDTKKPNVVLIISDQWSTKVADGSGNYSI